LSTRSWATWCPETPRISRVTGTPVSGFARSRKTSSRGRWSGITEKMRDGAPGKSGEGDRTGGEWTGMAELDVRGGNALRGDVAVSGSKNSALGILAAAAMADGESVLDNVPTHTDVFTMCRILRELGVRVHVDEENRFHIDGGGLSRTKPAYDL